jgi:hypothetical protein
MAVVHDMFNRLALAEAREVDTYDARPVEVVQEEVTPVVAQATPVVAQAEVPPVITEATPVITEATPVITEATLAVSQLEEPEAVLKRFISSDQDTLELPHHFSSEIRAQYHALASHFSLKHSSRGEGDNRFLTIYKPWALPSHRPSTHRERVSSELVKVSFPVFSALASNVQEVVEARIQSRDEENVPKRKAGRPPGSKKDKSAPSEPQATVQYSLRSRKN